MVSKSHHRLLFHLTGKEKSIEKYFFRDILSTGGRLYKGNVLAPFLSVVIYGLLGIFSFFKFLVCVCLENVLLRDNPCISPQGFDEVCFENLFF